MEIFTILLFLLVSSILLYGHLFMDTVDIVAISWNEKRQKGEIGTVGGKAGY